MSNVSPRLRNRGSRHPHTSRPPIAFRPILAGLEHRLAPAATLTVNTIADADLRDDVLSYREAILINNRTLAVSALTAAEQVQVSGSPTATDTDTIAFHIGGGGVQTITPLSE